MRTFPLFVCLLSGFLQLVESQAGGAATITATPIFPYLPLGQKSEDFQVLLRVEAPADAPAKPAAVAVVLDVSNDKIEYVNAAAGHVKEAAGGDIAVYVRSSNLGAGWVEVDALAEFHAVGRPAGGGHTAEDGLGMAHGYLSDKAGVGRSIILVSDAQDKTGILYDKDVAVHILDVGVGHDAMLHLHSMFIKEKGGTYSFVEGHGHGHEDKAELAGALAVLVARLKEVVAPAKTRITLGATVSHVERGGIIVPLATDDRDAFDIDVLYAGEVKNFIVHLDVAESFTPNKKQACKEKQQLLQCSVVGGSTTDVYITRPQDDGYSILPMPTATVVHHSVEFQLLQIVNELILVEDQTPEQLSTALTAKWAAFVKKHRCEVGWDMVGLQAKMDMIQSYLKKEHVSYSYIFSWVSGYQAQRPTVLGSWENHLAAAFVHTTAIKRWTKVVLNVNVKMQLQDGTICSRAAACKAPEHVLFLEGSEVGTVRLNPAYERTQLVKLNTVFKELFQAGCNADELARVANGTDGDSA